MPRRKSSSFKLEQVTVRMYRPGLGDCFLLTFHGRKGEMVQQRHMLIDCGVLQGTQNERERLHKVIQDIYTQTDGKLHALVVTHEHADHLLGFDYHGELFKSKFAIEQVWLAWTEDKDDPDVQDMYSAVRKVPIQVLERALEELKKANSPNYPYYKQLTQFLKDNGMQAVKDIAAAHGISPLYLSPNADQDGPTQVIAWDDFGGVRFHVLGPPSDPEFLKRSDPPKTKSRIDRGEALNQATAFAMAVLHLGVATGATSTGFSDPEALSAQDIEELFELSLPFDRGHGIPLEALKAPPARPPAATPAKPTPGKDTARTLFENYYGWEGIDNPVTEDKKRSNTGERNNLEYRRIDSDWLESAGSLALYLDGDINNTSLVLAIELGLGGQVLLFPGDAQYGNWVSWASTKRGRDLLQRTVLYKVGHHGSHNATLKHGALDLMGTAPGCDELVALIPVDTEKAKTKRGWRMPEPELRKMLVQQAHGRLILACEGRRKGRECDDFAYQKPAKPPRGARISQKDWDDFLQAMEVDEQGLWVAYNLQVVSRE
jgi:hypothetical protein